MKRLTAGLAVLGLLAAAPAALAAEEGDYNGDGKVDDADRDMIMAAMNTTPGDPGWLAAADHDGDGVISMIDVMAFKDIRDAQ